MIEFMRTTDFKLFDLFDYLRMLSFFVYMLFQIKQIRTIPGGISKGILANTKTEKNKTIAATILAIIEIIIFTTVNCIIAGTYAGWFGNFFNMPKNYFGVVFIGPFIFALICFILRIDIVKAFDIIAPAFAIALTFSKFGCFTAGCCYGAECEHGLYSYAHDAYEYPVQLIETGSALFTFIILMLIRKKAKNGILFPAFLFFYSATRFCSEFLRNEPDVIGKLKIYHICCLAGIALAVVFTLIALLFGDKISRLYTMELGIGKRLQKIADEISFNYHQIKKKTTKQKKPVVHHKKKKRK